MPAAILRLLNYLFSNRENKVNDLKFTLWHSKLYQTCILTLIFWPWCSLTQ